MTPLAPLSASSKITPTHLQRLAFIYVRQSSPKQVAQNKESQQYQYQLRQRAIELGWAAERVRVIDSDLGRSGSEASGRGGFQELVAEVSLDTRALCSDMKCHAWPGTIKIGITCWIWLPCSER